MKITDAGGSAFPEPYLNSKELALSIRRGMTLRDYFAAKAMNGILSGADYNVCAGGIAEQAYHVADEMIKQRNK